MDVSTFLKSHFGEDGSLARVLGKTNLGYGFGALVKIELHNYEDHEPIYAIIDICFWSLDYSLYSQHIETQRKIAELLGWRE